MQIGIASTSTGATLRYTVDGSTPSSSNGQIYSSQFILTQNATVKAIAYGRGWLSSNVASVDYSVLTPLPYWRALQNLSADGSQDMAILPATASPISRSSLSISPRMQVT